MRTLYIPASQRSSLTTISGMSSFTPVIIYCLVQRHAGECVNSAYFCVKWSANYKTNYCLSGWASTGAVEIRRMCYSEHHAGTQLKGRKVIKRYQTPLWGSQRNLRQSLLKQYRLMAVWRCFEICLWGRFKRAESIICSATRKFQEREDRSGSGMLFCLLKASGRDRAGTRGVWERMILEKTTTGKKQKQKVK